MRRVVDISLAHYSKYEQAHNYIKMKFIDIFGMEANVFGTKRYRDGSTMIQIN